MNDEDGFIAIYGEWTKIGIECLMFMLHKITLRSVVCGIVLTPSFTIFMPLQLFLETLMKFVTKLKEWGHRSANMVQRYSIISLTTLSLSIFQLGGKDQCPIVLKTHSHDYAAIPFKFFNSWILDKDFPDIVSRSWSPLIDSHNTSSNPHPAISLKLRLQELKKEIRLWRQNTVLNNDALCRELKTKIEHFDVKAELGLLDDAEIE
ncbi:hypothetical protein Tco_0841225 [Tanacetum coccineum]|uniref:Uncharacterized protein n=1 Tax=Tanacetum coccineum TaxID=301880 RepID=A0ABQ5AZA5_9ASTR